MEHAPRNPRSIAGQHNTPKADYCGVCGTPMGICECRHTERGAGTVKAGSESVDKTKAPPMGNNQKGY